MKYDSGLEARKEARQASYNRSYKLYTGMVRKRTRILQRQQRLASTPQQDGG